MEPETKKDEEKVEIPPQDPSPKKEEPSQKKNERSRLDKLRHTRASIEAQIAEEEQRNGIVINDDDDDDKPITRGDLKRIEREKAKNDAIAMANNLTDPDERSKVIDYLTTRVLPSGNASADFQFALDAVNSEKNRQIAEEAARKRGNPATRSSGGGAPAKEEDQFVPTQAELDAAAMVGKKTPADIKAFVLKAREREQSGR